MKKILFTLLFVWTLIPSNAKSTNEDVSVGIGGNAYVTKQSQQPESNERRRGGNRDKITDGGIRAWDKTDEVISVYFHLEKAQTLNVSLKGQGESTIKVSYEGKSHKVKLKSESLTTVKVGKFKVKTPGYVKIDLQGLDKKGETFGNITELILKNPEGEVVYVHDFSNYWGRRGPSVHIGYQLPKDKKIEWFYNEVTVPEEGDVIASYYMANGFGEGYFGMQNNSQVERRVLFSVWSPFVTDDPKSIPDEQKIKLLRKGEDVNIGEFGNEGSGGQSFLRYNWTPGLTYKFLMQVHPDGEGNTIYTAYFYATDESRWRLIASFMRPETDTWYRGAHSFLENFSPLQGYLSREVKFSNQWAMDIDGNWLEITRGIFTNDGTAQAGVRLDYQGGLVNEEKFYLKNGGFFNENTEYRKMFERKALGNRPVIDFEALEKL